MKAVVVDKVGSFRLCDIPAAPCAVDEVRLKVLVAGLCRTDLKLIRTGHRDLVLPRVPGEEVVGEVVEAGSAAGAWKPGQRAYVYPGTSCGRCLACRSGAENLCATMRIMGFHRDGGFAEYVTVPAGSLIALPDGISDEAAVFAEPLSCCINALELANLKEGEEIGIWGGGPAGTLLSRLALARGAKPVVVEPDERRRAHLPYAVISPPDETSFDVAVAAVGAAEAYQQAFGFLKPRGRLIVFSGLPPASAEQTVNLNGLHYREQAVQGAYGCSFRHGVEAISMISGGIVPVADLISHRMALEQLSEALDLVAGRSCMKIHLYPEGNVNG